MQHDVDGVRRRPPTQPELPAEPVGEGLPHVGHQPLGHVGERRVLLDDGIGGVALEVDEHRRQPDAAHAVGDRVVHLRQQRGPSVRQAFDDRVAPERAGPIEGIREVRSRVVEELAIGARRRQPDAAHVEVEIERRVVDPRRRRHAGGRRHDLLAEAGDLLHGARDAGPEPLERRHRVEERHVEERRAQARVLLEVPHQRLGVGHPTFRAHGPDWGVDHATRA
jgi:hypothetical protein